MPVYPGARTLTCFRVQETRPQSISKRKTGERPRFWYCTMVLQKYAHVGLINARCCAFTLGACMMMGVGFVGFVESPYTAVALLSLAGFAHQTLSVTVITMASDLFKKNEVGTVAGMAGTFGNAGLLIFSLLIGALVATIGYTPFFICLGVLDLVGAVVLWTLVRERNLESEAAALEPG
jgi:ACS family hexuronate transporter-like MFS transporter